MLNQLRIKQQILRCCLLTMSTAFLLPIPQAKAQSNFLQSLFGKQPVVYNNRLPGSFADIAEKLLPTVVNISTSRALKPGETVDDDDDDETNDDNSNNEPNSPFEKFFRDYMDQKGGSTDGSNDLQALGSGFIIDPSGYIVTNYHVIKDADKITVTLQNNRVLKATMIGFDERTDIALLKVHTKHHLVASHFGNSDISRVGDWVLAIGNPYGLSGTVTSGIISSRGRNIEQGPYDDFIQTDAPINKGNSGGPLFNMKGEVIGINTAIFSPSGGSIGIAFAIPANEAKSVIDQLRKNGKVSRAWVGVKIQEVSESIADSLNIQPFQGALVVKVDPNSPASQGGLKAGDVIQTLDGKIITAHTMPRIIAQMPIHSKINLNVLRQGQQINLSIITARLVDDDDTSNKDTAKPKNNVVTLKDLNISVSNITDILRQKYNLSEKQQGLVIVSSDRNKKNGDKDLKVGDVIVGANQHNIANVNELEKEIASIKQSKVKNPKQRLSILLLVQSGKNIHWIAVPFANDKPAQRKKK